MEFQLEFSPDPPHVIVTTSGRADPGGFRRYLEALDADPRFRPGTAMLVDHSGLVPGDLTSDQVREIASLLRAFDEEHRPGPRAVVAPAPAQFGLTRMALTLIDPEGEHTAAFRTRDDAADWIRRQVAR